MSIDEMFREFEYNYRPFDTVKGVNCLELPDDYLAFMSKHDAERR